MKKLVADTVTVVLNDFRVSYFPTTRLLVKENNRKLKNYYRTKYLKSEKQRPIVRISYPIISVENLHAIVYASYVTGALSGSSGYFILEKVDGHWKIIKYEMLSIS